MITKEEQIGAREKTNNYGRISGEREIEEKKEIKSMGKSSIKNVLVLAIILSALVFRVEAFAAGFKVENGESTYVGCGDWDPGFIAELVSDVGVRWRYDNMAA